MKIVSVALVLLFVNPAYSNDYYDYLHQKNVAKAAKKQAAIDSINRHAALCEKIGGAAIGFTAEAVLKSCWGKPQDVATTFTSAGKWERWLYPYGHLDLKNGIVSVMYIR